ncbi:MAG: FG-GAP repeat domain-containing protein [Actinomycetota bacterium]
MRISAISGWRFATAVIVGLTAVAFAASPGTASPERRTRLRDIGPAMGLSLDASSYGIVVHDLDDDGWTDLMISRHGAPAQLFRNAPDGDSSTGLQPIASFVDGVHGRNDRHGCAIADVDQDGLDDVFCAKGARQGTSDKWNELWMQRPQGTFTDRAAEYGVEDVWGRGRFPAFIDLDHDAFPDLFLGNDAPRRDQHRSPNRTFLDADGQAFVEVDLGLRAEHGNVCTVVADLNADGWQDLVVCGNRRLHVFERRPSRFVDKTTRLGLPLLSVKAAAAADVDADGRLDLVLVARHRVLVRLQGASGNFHRTVLERSISAGHGVAVGDVDGNGALDVFVVQGCVDQVNRDDLLFLGGDGERFVRYRVDPVPTGCGDGAAALDIDRDSLDDIVVTNGGGLDQPGFPKGPEQLLTMGDWQPAAT